MMARLTRPLHHEACSSLAASPRSVPGEALQRSLVKHNSGLAVVSYSVRQRGREAHRRVEVSGEKHW